jgi:hypothetical protein
MGCPLPETKTAAPSGSEAAEMEQQWTGVTFSEKTNA